MFSNFYQPNAGTQVAVAQPVEPRNIRVQYRGGFALINNFQHLSWSVSNNSDITVVEEPTLEQAYVNACNCYVQEYWKNNPYKQPALPTFEAVLKMPYYEPGFIKNVPSIRFFATINRDYVGIYDTVEGAIEFLNYFKPSGLKEFDSADGAKLWLNEKFILPILSMSAYITDKIPYLVEIPLNTAVPVHYREWWQQHFKSVDNLPFTAPKFLNNSKEVE